MKALSYIHGTDLEPLLGETIGENLRRTVEKFGHREALVSVHQNYRANYQTLWEQSTQIAKALLAHQVKKGDRVGIWSPNRYEWVIIQYATARIGAILVNINPAYRSHELEYALRQSGVSLLITAQAFKTSNYVETIAEVQDNCPDLREVLVLEKDWQLLSEVSTTISDKELSIIENSLQFDDAINIQYTSGTTGFPKGATLSHHNILNNGYFVGRRCNYTEKDRVCIPVPFYHCFGMVLGNLACTSHGACIVIPAEAFDPSAVLQAVQKERCTSLYGVPTMFIGELQDPDFAKYDLSSLRTGIMGGSPCPVEVMRQVKTKMNMNEVTICYGMTETSPTSTQTEKNAPLEKQVSTVGTIQAHVEVKIIHPETGAILSRGEAGELLTRGYSVMLGYWNNEKATSEAIDEAGWMHTGDLAVMDEEAYINIVGRIKDMILRGGENIYPREIEEFLYTHSAIADVQVIGVPSEKYGEEVMAWVKLKENTVVSEDELINFCKEQIAHFKIPRYWKFVTNFPMTVTGKIRKVEMRQISIKELDLEALLQVKTA